MTTEVILTGTGIPVPSPGRAGAGALVRGGGAVVQVDAGRATALRLAEAGVPLPSLSAVLLTHHHSDHLLGLTDLVLTRWVMHVAQECAPLPLYCPEGEAVEYARGLFDRLGPDIENRKQVSDYLNDPAVDIRAFVAGAEPLEVARLSEMVVETVLVEHGDLRPAVAYRFTTPDGVIVISGDTRACDAVGNLSQGADILVHEVFSGATLAAFGAPQDWIERLAHHHAEASEVGALAAQAGVKKLVLTHLIPPPDAPEAQQALTDQVRSGGYEGEITVGTDLATTSIT